MKLDTAKGVRDFPPEQKILRQEVVEKLKNTFEIYGFSPLETPIFERYEVLSAKFAAGEESDALKETFTFKDQGGRKLGLRFDLTVPLARFVGMNPRIKLPFKRYQIGRTFRDGPIKTGRYREFWQCDVDIVGCKQMTADAEIIRLTLDVFRQLNLDAYLELNSRKLIDSILEFCGIEKLKREAAILAVDKLKKYGKEKVKKEMLEAGIQKQKIEQALNLFSSNSLEFLKEKLGDVEGICELKEILSNVDDERLILNTSLARGLAYYTGPVFEGFLRGSQITSSICGGGRYDDMIGKYRDTPKEYPAVGISFGMEPITEFMKTQIEPKLTVTSVYVIPIDAPKMAMELAQKLRVAGINTDIDIMDRGLSKNLDYADKLRIPYALIVGKRDLENGEVTLKNMRTGDEKKAKIDVLSKNSIKRLFSNG